MSDNRALNNKINRLHERCLPITYNDKISTIKELLEKDHSSLYTIQTFKHLVANGMAPEMMNEIFQLRKKSHYNLRYAPEFIIPPIHSVYHGKES